MPISTKLGRLVAYRDGLPLIKSYDLRCFFFSLWPPRHFFGWTGKFLLRISYHLWPRTCVTWIGLLSLDTRFLANVFVKALFSFCMCEGDIPCALEKLVMAELSQLWGSYSFTNRNISPLLQYLWPPNLARWWLTIGAPTHKVTWSLIAWSWEIVWQVKVISPLPQDLWPLNLVVWISEKLPLVGYWIHGGASERKRQSRHRRLVVFFSFFFWSLLENWQARSFFGVYLIGRSQILFHLKVELKDAKIKWRKLLNF